MTDVTRILSQIQQGDSAAADQLLPVVYDNLRRLASQRMGMESPDHTLQPTALVHEAYVRLVNNDSDHSWESRGHFFSAAAEAMRRILVDHARRKQATKRGGELNRVAVMDIVENGRLNDGQLLALDEALSEFEELDPAKSRIVKLKFFAGMTIDETAKVVGISRATAQRHWAYARAWLFGKLTSGENESESENPRKD